MGFFRHALIGIGLYEGFKYLMRKDSAEHATTIGQSTPFIAATGHSDQPVAVPADDPWKNSLADDELRAPDS
ncbi:MAG: hypothetical protein V4594_24400 [Bacteroidota bacterium]